MAFSGVTHADVPSPHTTSIELKPSCRSGKSKEAAQRTSTNLSHSRTSICTTSAYISPSSKKPCDGRDIPESRSQGHDGGARNYDYGDRYGPDQPGKEADRDARVFKIYLDEAESYDEDMIRGFRDTADSTLMFATLFSAVITSFAIEASSALLPDNSKITTHILQEQSLILRALGNVTAIAEIPRPAFSPDSPTHSMLDVWTTALFLISLALSVLDALASVLTKQWLQEYRTLPSGTAKERALVRHYRFAGMSKWRFENIVAALPLMLHCSFGLFSIGFSLFVCSRHKWISLAIIAILVIAFSLYIIAVSLPAFYLESPFRIPLLERPTQLLAWCVRVVRYCVYRFSQPKGLESLCSLFADFWEHQTQCTSSSSPSHPLWPNLEFYSHRDALQHTALSSLETIFAAICWLGEVSTNPSVKLAAAQSLPGLLPTLSLPDPHGDLSTERWMALDEVQRKRIVRALLPLYSTVWSILRDTIWHVYPNFPEVIDPNSREYNVWIRAEVLARSLIYHFGDETDFKAVAQHRTTAFVKSIQGRSPELFRFLIDYGLVIALPHSNTLEQRRWIRHRDIDVCVPLEGAAGDFTALHSLAESDSNIQMLQSLIPFRPNFNVFSGVSRKTPLHVASASGSIQVVQWLCAQRADPYLVDANGFTPFVLAIHRGHFDIAEYIFQHHSMSAANSPVPIPHSITSEHNLFGHRRHWSQALLIACQDGCVPVVQTLLSEGVNPNDWDFISPLHKACASGHLEIVELLHDHGFDFTAGSPVNSPLFDACGLGHIRIVKRLLDFGVDVNLQAIDAGSERESSDVPPGQSNSSAVNSAKDNDSTWAYKAGVADGRTALHLACANGDVEMVRLLFNYSADPTLLDSQQRLALDVAREFSHWDIVKMFPD